MLANILLIDDDQYIQEFVGAFLADEGYQVIAASHRSASLDLINEYHPSLILIDIPSAKESITTLLNRFREKVGTPIIILTTSMRPAILANQFCADSFLSKPFDLDELLKIVRQHMIPN